MKKVCLFLAALTLLAATGCAAQGAAVSATPAVVSSPAPTPTPEAVSATVAPPTPTPVPVPDAAMLTLYEGGEYIGDVSLEDAADMQVLSDAIMEAALSAYAEPAADMADCEDYIQLYLEYTDGTIFEYYAFEQDGSYCLQGIDSETYATIADDTYAALYALAKGDA